MGKTKSETKKDSFFEERLVGGHHWKTTISDDESRVTRRALTPEESQKRASKAWEKEKEK